MARLAIYLGPNEIGLALSRIQAGGIRLKESSLVVDAGRDGQALIPAVDALLRSAGTPLAELEAIAFGAGPGGFSRVRVSCAVAQGLALSIGCQVIPVSSMQAIALAAARLRLARVLVLVDARMQEVYCAAYVAGQGSQLSTALEPTLLGVSQVDEYLQTLVPSDLPIIRCGDAWQRYREGLAQPRPLAAIDPAADDIAMACLALTDQAQWRAPASAAPIYLREKIALNITEQAALRARNARA